MALSFPLEIGPSRGKNQKWDLCMDKIVVVSTRVESRFRVLLLLLKKKLQKKNSLLNYSSSSLLLFELTPLPGTKKPHPISKMTEVETHESYVRVSHDESDG